MSQDYTESMYKWLYSPSGNAAEGTLSQHKYGVDVWDVTRYNISNVWNLMAAAFPNTGGGTKETLGDRYSDEKL